MKRSFQELGISPLLTELLKADGVVQPTPVQERAIPAILEGQDVIVQAQTGTGKTLAFVLPILQAIRPEERYVQALIVTPTRELALQITEEARKLQAAAGAAVLAAYGGQDVIAQIHKLEEAPHVVIGTPGRLLDHLRRETIRLDRLSMLVLDEADQMLHLGFLPEVEGILEQTPEGRQTMLFSATMPDHVRQLARRYMRQPLDIRIEGRRVTLEEIEQVAIETTDRAKQATLAGMLEQLRPYLAVVFCRTKIRAKKLNAALQAIGFEADELHGDLTQAKREEVMQRFREARLRVLVATDVAARGLDVEGVTHVFNYDIPHDAESYIHRIGRTGRAGQSGAAFTFVAPRDLGFLTDIEGEIGMRLPRRKWAGPEVRSSRPVAETGGDRRSGRGTERANVGRVGERDARRSGTRLKRELGDGRRPNGGREERRSIDRDERGGRKPAAHAGSRQGHGKSASSGKETSRSGGTGRSRHGGTSHAQRQERGPRGRGGSKRGR